jgi:hypothetical protein
MTTDDAGTVPEAGSDPTPTVPAPHQRPARPKRWRPWRRSRPFWGGLLLILAGLELLAIPLSGVLVSGAVKLVIYIGIAGVAGVVIGALLIVAGLVTWFNPANKTFYSIAGIVLGLVSFPASNLGGLLIGMLLAILGGSIAFAWMPFQADPDSLPAAAAAPDGAADEVVPLADLLTPDDEAPAPEPPVTDEAPAQDLPAVDGTSEPDLSAAQNEAALS